MTRLQEVMTEIVHGKDASKTDAYIKEYIELINSLTSEEVYEQLFKLNEKEADTLVNKVDNSKYGVNNG